MMVRSASARSQTHLPNSQDSRIPHHGRKAHGRVFGGAIALDKRHALPAIIPKLAAWKKMADRSAGAGFDEPGRVRRWVFTINIQWLPVAVTKLAAIRCTIFT
jgi:hypothetical protein